MRGWCSEEQHKQAAKREAGEPIHPISPPSHRRDETAPGPPTNGLSNLSLASGKPASKPSLAALAAARNAKAAPKPSPSLPSTTTPLSKLAMKAAAATANKSAPSQPAKTPSTGLSKLQMRAQGLRPAVASTQAVEPIPPPPEPITPSSSFFPSPKSPSVAANPSPFASVLGLMGGKNGAADVELGLRGEETTIEAFSTPSPDDVVLNARKGTSLGQRTKIGPNR